VSVRPASVKRPSLYVCAPINALVEGIYREPFPLEKLREHGDFGLGTLDSLDGEMVMLDGRVYQILSSGVVSEVTKPVTTPFAAVTWYTPASHDDLSDELDYDGFLDWLLTLLPSPNLIYALLVEGRFADVKVRSMPRQEGHKPLVEVAREQSEFTFVDVSGTISGFYTPSFLESVSAPGLHLHFLSEERTEGGHLLSCRPRGVRVGVQFISTLEVGLPLSLDYLTWDFRRDTGADLEEAEK
jgi:acetolactate decarboxylase